MHTGWEFFIRLQYDNHSTLSWDILDLFKKYNNWLASCLIFNTFRISFNFYNSLLSISTTIFIALLPKSFWLYAIWPESNLDPRHSIKSDYCWQTFAAYWAETPGLPINSGWFSSIKSKAFHVVKTGICTLTINLLNYYIPPDNLIPFPASIIGFLARDKSDAIVDASLIN